VSYNPTDPTQWFRDHISLASGFTKGFDGWGYSNCGVGTVPSYVLNPQTVLAGQWAKASGTNATCFLYFPYGGAAYDYWSGAAPSSLWVQATYQTTDTNGTHYVGLANSVNDGQAPDFIGCRQSGAGNWFAVIRAGGADIATADTGVPHNNNPHRFVVDNNSGASNTIRCSVDGGKPATANGVVPSETYGWMYVAGALASGAPAANFSLFQYTIFLLNLPRQ
jgi:hypothetical protein